MDLIKNLSDRALESLVAMANHELGRRKVEIATSFGAANLIAKFAAETEADFKRATKAGSCIVGVAAHRPREQGGIWVEFLAILNDDLDRDLDADRVRLPIKDAATAEKYFPIKRKFILQIREFVEDEQ